MSLQPQPVSPIPAETIRVARAAFPKGNIYMLIRDELGTIYEEAAFTQLFSKLGLPAEPPWRLVLDHAIRRRALGSTSCRCCAKPNRLEVYAGAGLDRLRL